MYPIFCSFGVNSRSIIKFLKLGQSLEVLQSNVAHVIVGQVQRFQVDQAFQVLKSVVGDFGVPQIEHGQVGQSSEVLQSRAGDVLTGIEIQLPKTGQPFQMLKSRIRDLGEAEVERLQIRKSPQVLQSGVGHLGEAEAQEIKPVPSFPFELLQIGVRDVFGVAETVIDELHPCLPHLWRKFGHRIGYHRAGVDLCGTGTFFLRGRLAGWRFRLGPAPEYAGRQQQPQRRRPQLSRSHDDLP